MLEALLKKQFGYGSFRQGQKKIIQDVLAGKDVLAMLPTGSGKSLCYQLPAYCLEGPVLIVSPLLSLMEDQVQELKSFGEKRVIALNSLLGSRRKLQALKQLPSYRFIFASPETLQNDEVNRELKRVSVSLFVVDEAHCISQWGYEFRTDYLKLEHVLEEIGRPPCLALTATATANVQDDIVRRLNLRDARKHIYSVDRPNIGVYVEHVRSSRHKVRRVLDVVKQLEPPGIIYFSSREWSERFANFLKDEGVARSAYYHGGMESEERLLIQQQFLDDDLEVICSTNAFGMGVNKANVRFVIHFHYPKQVEFLLQEIGRAGRDGKDSAALLFYEDGDHDFPAALIRYEFPASHELERVLTFLADRKNITNRELTEVYERMGLSETAGRFITHRLERNGVLKGDCVFLKLTEVERIKTDVLKHVQNRINIKSRKLAEMRQWLFSTGCRRNHYLQMFDEPPKEHPAKCCDVCGLKVDDYFIENFDDQTDHRIYSWQEDLRLLLQQSEGSNET